jgi:hypothetical protein
VICSECGSYQPDRAKFCGICGAALSQEGLMESFLKDRGDAEIVLPKHRSFLFYLTVTGVVLVALLIFAGAGYLVYRAAWGGSGTKAESDNGVQDNMLEYTNDDIGFTFSYLDNWRLEQPHPVNDQLVSLKLSLSSQKTLEITGYQLDPTVTIGGLQGIEDYLTQDATQRMQAQGVSNPVGASSSQASGGTDQATAPATGQTSPDATQEEISSDIFISSQVSGLPVFYLDFNANVMGEATSFILYYVIADDYYFLFEGRAPQGEFKDVRSQIMAMAGSFKWVRPEASGDDNTQPAGE